MTDAEFFELERSHTYIGKGFWKRAFMLVAGIAVNILTGFLLVIAVYSALGVSTPMDLNVLGDIVVDSPAQQAVLVARPALPSMGAGRLLDRND
ncbi:MAG: hypothetical protein ACLUW6_09360 [Coriobacteriaceae bacterium]